MNESQNGAMTKGELRVVHLSNDAGDDVCDTCVGMQYAVVVAWSTNYGVREQRTLALFLSRWDAERFLGQET